LLVACELVAAVRAVRISQPSLTQAQHEALELCAPLPTALEDRNLTPDIELAEQLVPALGELVDLD